MKLVSVGGASLRVVFVVASLNPPSSSSPDSSFVFFFRRSGNVQNHFFLGLLSDLPSLFSFSFSLSLSLSLLSFFFLSLSFSLFDDFFSLSNNFSGVDGLDAGVLPPLPPAPSPATLARLDTGLPAKSALTTPAVLAMYCGGCLLLGGRDVYPR